MTIERMLSWLTCTLAAVTVFWAQQAYAASAAVMPVEGVNLTPGECDAIGVLLTDALARDARVAVLSPLESRPVRQQSADAPAAAAQMGVAVYVQLTAMRLATSIKLDGTLFNRDGSILYRAQTVAPDIETMDAATAKLARALVTRQPIAPEPLQASQNPAVEAPPGPESTSYPKALGAKVTLMVPHYSGRTFSPLVGGQFDGRIGTRDYFFEFGVGAALPTEDSRSQEALRISILFAEIGGSYYLTKGAAGIYAGGGAAPALWISDAYYSSSKASATLAVYGQLGLTFTRDSRVRLYSEVRVSQYCLSVVDPLAGSYDYPYAYSTGTSDSYYPLTIAFQMGLGW